MLRSRVPENPSLSISGETLKGAAGAHGYFCAGAGCTRDPRYPHRNLSISCPDLIAMLTWHSGSRTKGCRGLGEHGGGSERRTNPIHRPPPPRK